MVAVGMLLILGLTDAQGGMNSTNTTEMQVTSSSMDVNVTKGLGMKMTSSSSMDGTFAMAPSNATTAMSPVKTTESFGGMAEKTTTMVWNIHGTPHLRTLLKTGACSTAHRPSGPAYSTDELLNMPQFSTVALLDNVNVDSRFI